MTDDEAEITACALAAGRGDQDAAARFVRATQQQVRRFLAALVSPTEADDLAQETFLRAFRSLPSFAGRSSARTWLLAIARRVAADHVRTVTSRPRTVPMSDGYDDLDVSRSGFDGQVVLEQLIAALPAERREAFVATQVLGLPYAEAAAVCDCPVGTIRSRVARAREDLVAAVDNRTAPGSRRGDDAAG
ncbi:sigma-70 family RNA polymerase sigma factor [Micromonospora sp. C28SCA-DRY-2]|uniref:sigma-70 family RNA polymerase sigma factor n=1 Tax=Micromonospora sp. C28SCA-DRY-2 TaxID=3059522 RepID=UPI002675F6DD|nr:sigma-70 family RNA polymerase sigma factor [Micromonospora sp. C28SCA-DRY-2]MDO3703110.1 sigma-70 family RNA polymerase sigma factor [Micromonospora sp. C28SCA-DRY-2]